MWCWCSLAVEIIDGSNYNFFLHLAFIKLGKHSGFLISAKKSKSKSSQSQNVLNIENKN